MNIVKANFHTHTTFCDGTDTAEDVVKKAIELGMTNLGFSSHLDPDPEVTIRDFPGYLAETRRLQAEYADRIEILVGAEVDSLMLRSAAEGTEYIIGSTHYLNLKMAAPVPVDSRPEIMFKVCDEYFGGDYYKLVRSYFEFEAEVVDRLHPDFIGHFDLVSRFNDQQPMFDTGDARYRTPALEALEHLVKYGIPFEINCGAVNRGRKKEYYPDMFLLKKLHDFGGEIMINSDAHQKELLMGAFEGAYEAAAACGFDHINILTKEGTGKVHLKALPIL